MLHESKLYRTKQIIVDTAFKLFHENGFKSTSIDTIMKATTLSKGAFYHHYESKKELALEVISLKLQKRVYEIMILPLLESGNSLDILHFTFVQRLSAFSDYDKKHGCIMNNFINEIGDYESAYQNALKNIIEQWKLALILLIERGKKDKQITQDISSEAVAIYLISAFEGIRGIRKLYNDDQIIQQYCIGISSYLNHLKT